MAAVPATFVLFVYFTLASSYTLLRDDDNEIIWPTEYHFKGEKLDFITTQKETFEMWYSADLNRSRIDVYGGTVKKWYLADLGYTYQKHPIADVEATVEEECVARRTNMEQLDFLPYVSDLTYTGQSITLYDKVVDIWTSKDENGKMVTERTLYVFKTDSGVDIPVQQVQKKYNLNIGELEEHVITNYFDFEDTVSEEEVTIDEECKDANLGKTFHKDIKLFHPDLPSELDQAFDLYTNYHNKLYQDQEHQMRKSIFEKNWRKIEQHNRKNLGFRIELNEFSDKTEEELAYLTGTYISKDTKNRYPEMTPFPHTLEEIEEIVQELPESFDLRMEGAVTPIKNQAHCGSCWAFCTTAAVEGALARVNGERLLDLSEQSLVDCAWAYKSHGCRGGYMDGAMKYVLTHGIPTEEDYGVYLASDSYCKIQNMTSKQQIRGFSQVTPRNPNAMKVALYKYGPVTVGVHVSFNFVHYSSGVFYDPSCEFEAVGGHCITVVGYGVRDGEDYWIVKNSWGEIWGEDGYVLMSAKDNNCQFLDYAHYPIV